MLGDHDSCYPVKIFGASVDASDDSWTLQLKHAAMEAQRNGMMGLCADPYDALFYELIRSNSLFEPADKFHVPSWLRPLPLPEDRSRITKENMADHVAEGGMLALSKQA